MKILKSIFKWLLYIIVTLILIVGMVILYILFRVYQDKPKLDIELLNSNESTIIYDADGEVIAELGLYLRDNIKYDEMASILVDAFLSIEDARYFDHFGFDLPRFLGAAMANYQTKDFSQGGSTITMQLIKNSYFQVDNGEESTLAPTTIERKLQEIMLAMELDYQYEKEEIFELYVNKLNFGGNIRGVEKAAQYYFGKSSSEVNLSEAAFLAGVINLPNTYNPLMYLEYATERRDEVLDQMVYHGYISEIEATLAKEVKLEDLLVCDDDLFNPTNSIYQAYIDAAIADVYELTGLDPVVNTMQIHTHLDRDVQNEMNKITNGEYEHIQHTKELKQLSMVSIENETGAVIALSGGRNYQGARMFNRATEMYVQPGSSIKPLLTYALAFEELGWATSHYVRDQPIQYEGSDFWVNNHNNKFYGDISIYFALGLSLNTPVVDTMHKLVDKLGVDYIVDYLSSLGFENFDTENFDIGYAIGGSGLVVSPEELAGAYAALLNQGVVNKPTTIDYIVPQYGDPIYIKPKQTKALSPEAAYLVSTMTLNNVSKINGMFLDSLRRDYQVFGKTGTSDWGNGGVPYGIPVGASRDQWMVAQTTKHTNVIWEGYDEAVKGGKTWIVGADTFYDMRGKALNIILDTLYPTEESYPSDLVKPEGISEIKHIKGTWPYATGSVGSYTKGDIKDEFNKTINIYDTDAAAANFSGVSGSVNGDHYNVTFNGFPYQNADGQWKLGLSVPDGPYYEGNVVFDYSWIYGTPTYYLTIKRDGYPIEEMTGSSPHFSNYIEPYGLIEACGYVYYGGSSYSSTSCSVISR